MNFVWPAQTEAAMAVNRGQPIAYPPLIVPHETGGVGDLVYSWRSSNNQVENAYDVADLRAAADVGHWHWDDNQELALRYHIRLQRSGSEAAHILVSFLGDSPSGEDIRHWRRTSATKFRAGPTGGSLNHRRHRPRQWVL